VDCLPLVKAGIQLLNYLCMADKTGCACPADGSGGAGDFIRHADWLVVADAGRMSVSGIDG
jgi:hypothetical protein